MRHKAEQDLGREQKQGKSLRPDLEPEENKPPAACSKQ